MPVAIALLIAVVSLFGILDPSIYARETAGWAAQAVGQDWFDLVVLAPCLVIASAWPGRAAARILDGALVCTLYTFAIYTFAVHFNALFLIYCAVFGLAFFALARRMLALFTSAPEPAPARERGAGIFLIAIGVLFGALWLADIVPALAHRTAPPSLAETGLLTNPVHVIDLSIVLPSFVAVGVGLYRARRRARELGEVLLGFGVLMALSIAALLIVMRLRAQDVELGVAGVMIAIAAASAAVLTHLVRAPERA